MGKERSHRKALALLLCNCVSSVCLLSLGYLIAPACGDDSVTISCYSEGRYIDDVTAIVDVAQAAQLCDSTYYDCRGQCIGCFDDFDVDEKVCVDMNGNKFSPDEN
ncbi:MAG: hypothetical protein ACLPX5_14370 [Dissulfurispiraceae bacterium]